MTVETETPILKAIEKLEQKLDKFVDTTQKDLTDLKVGQARLESDVQSLKEDVKELKTIYKWVIGLIVTLNVGIGTLVFRVFDLFPKA